MPTLMKRLGNLNSQIKRVGKKAQKMYPDIKWVIQMPEQYIQDTYGEGFILSGYKEDKEATYFILKEDPRIENWIHMIAIELDPQVQE